MRRFKNLEFDQSKPATDAASVHPGEPIRDEHFYMHEADEARRQGYYENALRFFSRALEFDKKLVESWVGQVRMLIELEEYPEAITWSTKALELFRDNPELMAGKAQALARRGDTPNALVFSDGAIQKPGQSAYRWIVRGELMVATRQRTDTYLFEKAVLADPDWIVLLDIGRIYLHYDQPAKAVPWVRRAVEKVSASAYASLIEGISYARAGHSRPARKSFRCCLELAPNHLEALAELKKLDSKVSSIGSHLWRLFGSG